MALIHCIYCSASTKANDLGREDLDDLLEVSRRNNAASGITGMLLYQNGSFFQVLEGDETDVQTLFEKIAKDKRHNRATKIIWELIEARSFSAWTMGYPKISSKELEEIPGLNDFFSHGKSYLELGESRAKTLLGAFKEGKWRAALP